jgi:hypothetical protein
MWSLPLTIRLACLARAIAIPFRQFKLDDSPEYAILPGASRTALAKLRVYVGH